MKRGEFFKSFVGLIGVVSSAKELSLINTPNLVYLSPNTRIGDLVMNRKGEVFHFNGKQIRKIDRSNPVDINAVIGTKQNENFISFANCWQET